MPKTGHTNHKKPLKKPITKAQNVEVGRKPRRVKMPPYRPISLKRRIKPVRPALTGAFRLFWNACGLLKRHWKLFLGIVIVYGLLNIILVRGLASTSNLGSLKTTLNGLFEGPSGKLTLGFTLFLTLVAGAGTSNTPTAGVYQALLLVIISLAVIWSLRKVYSNETLRIRDGFYRGMYPFVPFVLVLLVVGLQLLPLLIGSSVYSTVVSKGIAVHLYEKFLWGGLFFVLALVSLYMLCSSLFALYIVTLPDMTPMKALRSARQLVRYRRFIVMRKIIFLPVALLILVALIIIPISLTITPAAEWIFFALSLFGLPIIHSYMYALYRELLQ